MRVLHITRDFPPRTNGGISVAVGGMVEASRRSGLDCAVVSFDGWRPRARASTPANEPVVQARAGVEVLRLSTPAQLPAARRFAEEYRPDLLHVHHGMLWDFAEEVRKRQSAPGVLTVHVYQKQLNRLRGVEEETLSLAAQHRALGRAVRVLAPSAAVADLLVEDDPALAPRLRVVGLGTDDSASARKAVAGRCGHRGGPALYAGRFGDVKGTAELFAAIPRVIVRVPEASFAIAGGLPDNSRTEARWRRRFERDANARTLSKVRFAGWLPEEKLASLYRDASVLVCPSWFETFGLSVLEGMLYGLPVAATRCGGVPELIEHGRTGLLCQPGDVQGLADNLVTLLRRQEYAKDLGQAAAAEVRSRWLWETIIPRLVDVYEEMC